MKKKILIFIGILIILFAGYFFSQKFYYVEKTADERDRERMEIFTKRVNEFLESKSGKFNLSKNIILRWRIQNFKKSEHKLEYCDKNNQKIICEIDNEDWYGSHLKTALPKNQLKDLFIFIDNNYIKLETSQMFNPNFGGELFKNQFKIEKYSDFYILYGFFSDGAGTYTTNWKIKNGKSERRKLSIDEKDFDWQITE